VAQALRLVAAVDFKTIVPAVVNDAAAATFAEEAVAAELGPEAIGAVSPSMGSEDFAHVLQQVPGAMIRLGVRSPSANDVKPIHTSTFDLDEAALGVGVTTLCAIALRRNQRGAPA
jgi:metal-dependent amidase/aminoacylase/carboxypeptidase family protein